MRVERSLRARRSVQIGALLLGWALCAAARAATWTVEAAGGGDFSEIQSAIDHAATGDVVFVRRGEHVVDTALTFRGKGITVRGESGAAATIIRLADDAAPGLRQSLFVFDHGEDTASVLEGFTLRGGRGTRSCAVCPSRGGGIHCQGSSPTLGALRVEACTADFGGGVYLGGEATPVVTACTFEANSARLGGGVCIADDSGARLTGCRIAENTAETGGGLHVSGASPRLEGCRIVLNSVGEDEEGGGIYIGEAGAAELVDCEIRGNRGWRGGGLACVRSSPSIEGCIVAANVAESGGGLFLRDAHPSLLRCRIESNRAEAATESLFPFFDLTGLGGGLAMQFSSPTLTHCVIAANRGFGAALAYTISQPHLENCTLWGNGGGWLVYRYGDSTFGADFLDCIVWGNPGGGDISEDPLFCGWSREELHVDPGAASGGDGTPENPFATIDEVFALYSLGLREGSPFIGAGRDGADMGADIDSRCGAELRRLTLHLVAGTHELAEQDLPPDTDVVGSGPEDTVLAGTVSVPFDGTHLADLEVRGGVDVRSQDVELRNVAIRSSPGVGLDCDGSVRLENCTISASADAGVRVGLGSYATLEHCTISGNGAAGIYRDYRAPIHVSSCIVWDNVDGSVSGDERSELVVTYSCLEGPLVGGAGNIDSDPLFCGWDGGEEVRVDLQAAERGDGSAANPFRTLGAALDADLFGGFSLQTGSPCLGSGEDGGDMGAQFGVCEKAGSPTRLVRLAAGVHEIGDRTLVHGVSLEGEGEDRTSVRGTIHGLETGARLARLTVIGGVEVSGPERPVIEEVTIRGNRDGLGLSCRDGAVVTLRRSTIQEHSTGVIASSGSFVSLEDCVVRDNEPCGIDNRMGRVDLRRSTIVYNTCGVKATEGGSVSLVSCIVWGNANSIELDREGIATAEHSCIELNDGGFRPRPDQGNISDPPRFCGWRSAEARVDDDAAPGGDGNVSRPFATLEEALDPREFRLALAAGSPCIGTGLAGENMGAALGVCAEPPIERRTVVLDAGEYTTGGRALKHRASLRGAGDGSETIVEGPVTGASTGAALENLTITVRGNEWPGIVVPGGEAPVIRGCTILGIAEEIEFFGERYEIVGETGVFCLEGSAPTLEGCWIEGVRYGLSARRSEPKLTNCVISSCLYSGVTAREFSEVKLFNTTIAASGGAALSLEGGTTLTARNTIIWGNERTLSRDGTIDAAYSLIELPDGEVAPGPGNINADPRFVSFPGDYRLAPGSPAIDAGLTAGAPTADIDGNARRPCGAGIDMGAYETGGCPPAPALHFLRGDCGGDGAVDLADAVYALFALFLGAADLGCDDACDSNDDGALDVTDPIATLAILFLAEGPMPLPGMTSCGPDETDDDLRCAKFAPCP